MEGRGSPEGRSGQGSDPAARHRIQPQAAAGTSGQSFRGTPGAAGRPPRPGQVGGEPSLPSVPPARALGLRRRSLYHCRLFEGGSDVSVCNTDAKVSEEMQTVWRTRHTQRPPSPRLFLLLAGAAT